MLSTEQSPLQEHIQFLENSHREEMEQHAPLYAVGLESLAMENLLRVHEDEIKNIHVLHRQLRNRSGDLVSSANPLQLRKCATFSTISYC